MSKSKSIVDLIIKLDSEGRDKNFIIRTLFLEYGEELEFSDFEKYYKESGIGKKKCYRTKTTDMFLENPDLTIEEWSNTMILDGFLSVPEKFKESDDDTRVKEGIKNYRQLFPMMYCLHHHISMSELK